MLPEGESRLRHLLWLQGLRRKSNRSTVVRTRESFSFFFKYESQAWRLSHDVAFDCRIPVGSAEIPIPARSEARSFAVLPAFLKENYECIAIANLALSACSKRLFTRMRDPRLL